MIANILLLISLTLSPAEAYNQGNGFYNQKDYPKAIEAYQEALKSAPSAVAYYNLGNSYFKSGQIGRAIISYRRAQFLDPRDNDISNNLLFTRNYRADKTLTLPGPFEIFVDQLFYFFSLKESLLWSAFCFALGSLLLSLFFTWRRNFLLYGSLPFFLAFLFFAMNTQIWRNVRSSHPVVVVAPEISAQSGPGEEYKEIILVHDGTEGLIKERRGDYVLIQLPGGVGGWMKNDAVEEVF
jgi:tetratricopeptide (TPR) repeat protein